MKLQAPTQPVFFQLPRNFLFFQRLPARFAMLVLSAGRETPKGQWFTVEIEGQSLNILSRAQLKPGTKVFVEKSGDLQLKLVKEEPSLSTSTAAKLENKSPVLTETSQTNIFVPESFLDIATLLALKILEEQDQQTAIKQDNTVFRFSLQEPVTTQGVFVPHDEGWLLFISQDLSNEERSELLTWLQDLGVKNILQASEAQLKQLGHSVDILS